MSRVWIGLGSNQGQSKTSLASALCAIDHLPETQVVAVSPVYRTPPWGVTTQDDFLNAVAELSTGLSPDALLDELHSIERRHGRVRTGERWGPRTLDLDILVIEQERIDSDHLQVPHPRLHQRAFVLVPLNDLAPDLVIPGFGPVKRLLSALDAQARADIKQQGALEYHRAP